MKGSAQPSSSSVPAAPLGGLVMAGGYSRRMGRDKAGLDYHGRPQWEWTRDLLREVVDWVGISCREEQKLGAPSERIPDTVPGQGPIGGFLAAHARAPGYAWLAVACDLPRLDEEGLHALVAARAPGLLATAYASAEGLPEPLCAIYEPAIFPRLREALAGGTGCPRRVLRELGDRVRLVPLPRPDLLDNANTPKEAAALGAPEMLGGEGARE